MKKTYLVSYLQIKEMQEIVDNAILVTPKKATEFGIRLYQLSFPCFYVCEEEIWLTLQNFIHEANKSCHSLFPLVAAAQ